MSTFITLLRSVLSFFTSFPQIFFKDFIKERRHLHFTYSLVITFLSLLFAHKFMYFGDVQIWGVLFIAAFEGYVINWLREGHYENKYGAPFDYLDIYAGTYGGIAAAIIYLLII